MVPRPSSTTLLALASLTLGTPADALAAAGLEELEGGAREAVARRCLAVQYREGVAAYRRCVLDAAPAATALDALAFDDRHALERACEEARRESRSAARACLESGHAALAGEPVSPFDTLRRDERDAVRLECDGAATRAGIAGYRRCVDGALDALETLPSVDLAALSLPRRGALSRRCATSDTAADYRRCLLEATGVVATDAPEPPGPTVTAEPSPDERPGVANAASEVAVDGAEALARVAGEVTAPRDRGEAGRAAEAPADAPAAVIATDDAAAPADPPPPAAERPPAQGDDAAGSETETTAGTPSADDRTERASDAAAPDAPEPAPGSAPDEGSFDLRGAMEEAWARLRTTVEGLDTLERAVLGAALALPLLLLGAWLALRRRSPAAPRPAAYGPAGFDEPFDERGERSPWLDERGERLAAAFDDTLESPPPWPDDVDDASGSLAAALDSDARREPAPDERPGGRDPVPDEADTADDTRPVPSATSDPEPPATGASRDDRPSEARRPSFPPLAPRSVFGRELVVEDEALGRQRAIEFLIYWMAYGDERYAPETRAALLQNGGGDEDPHERTKRRVLEGDTQAFADTVRWLQRHADELQRVQIIDLLMVLLISERAMTPAQNTLLRFLADAFGLGADALDERHELAFGEPMPRLPRVDLPLWWAGVEPDRPLRWDARALAELDEQVRCRARLGLPLEGELGEEEIIAAFRRAARRCHPHRFDALGEREQALAERQFGKFEQARDLLLGVSA